MPRIQPVDPANAQPPAKARLEQVKKALGGTPNLLTTLAQSPAALGAYLAFGQALGEAKLSNALREQIALAVAGANSCEYCASAHTLLGKKAGVAGDELTRNLRVESSDARTAAALRFAKAIVATRGFVSDADLQAVRAAGYTDEEVLEILATVVLNIFTNYTNHIAQTEVDFPRVAVPEPAHA